MRDYTIGEAARDSGVKVNTIRFYEERGLLAVPPRSGGNQRLYDTAAVARLRFIRHARDLGFGLPAIADLLELAGHPQAACADADAIAQAQLAEVERRIRHLTALRAELGLGPAQGVVAIDGKSLRRGYEKGRSHMPPLMVSTDS